MYVHSHLLSHTSFEAYLFDLDGTLLNTTPDIAYAVNVMRASEDLPALSLSEVERGVGRGATELILATTPPQMHDRVHELRQVFVHAYQDHLCVDTYPYEGAIECLKMISKRGKRLALITNKPERLATPLLDAFAWNELFELKLYGDSLSERKPSPLPINHTIERLRVERSRCVFIGDTEVDAQAAQSAGVHFWAVNWGRVAESVKRGIWGDRSEVLASYNLIQDDL